MTQFWAFFKTEFKNKRKVAGAGKSFAWFFLRILRFVFLSALGVGVVVVVSDMLIKLCVANHIENEFLIFLLLLFILVQTAFATHEMVKNIKSPAQSKEMLSMPVDSAKVFFVQACVLYIQQIAFSILILVPVLTVWGLQNAMTPFYYGMIAPVILLLPVVPFFLGFLLSFPLARITTFFQQHFFAGIIVLAFLVAGGFYLYTGLLKFLLSVFESQSYQNVFTLEMIEQIQSFTSHLWLPVLFKNLLLGASVAKSLVVLLSCAGICTLTEGMIAQKFYFVFLRSGVLGEPKIKQKRTVIKHQNVFWLLMKKEFINVYRTPNYSFSFLTVALTTPIIVFFCNSILSEIGLLGVGESLYPALTLLILLIFMTLLNSFAATSVTREGKSFPITKSIPVSAKTQIYAKIVFYLMIEIPVVASSALVLHFAGYIALIDLAAIFVIACLVMYGGICFAVYDDIKNPQFHRLTDNVAVHNNPNISKNVLAGLVVAFVLGICSVFLVLTVDKLLYYGVIALLSALYMLFGQLRLNSKLEKNYQQIEN